MKRLIIITLLLLVVSLHGQDEPLKSPQIAIKIPLGEEVMIEGVYVAFAEVVEDSRCPKNVNCMWEGRAVVSVAAREPEEIAELYTVVIDKAITDRNKTEVLYSNERFIWEIVGLHPYPEDGVPKTPYFLLVRLTEKS